MVIKYQSVYDAQRDDLEELAAKDVKETREKISKLVRNEDFERERAKFVFAHAKYAIALNSALEALSNRYHLESNPITPEQI